MGAEEPSRSSKAAARRTHTVMVAVRYVSIEASILLWKLLWVAAWFLWKLLCSAGGQVFSLAQGGRSQHELASGKALDAEDKQLEQLQREVVNSAAQKEEKAAEEMPSEHCSEPTDDGKNSCNQQGGEDSATGQDLVLRYLRLPAAARSAEATENARRELFEAVEQVRASKGHQSVRFSVQVESERNASVAVLGGACHVREACEALATHVDLDPEERTLEQFFLVHFTMRESWDLPQDDELVEASIANDWVDLGNEGGAQSTTGNDSTNTDDGAGSPKSPQAVLRQRLQEVLHEREDVHIFMDDNPFATTQKTAVRVDFAGVLPHAWDAVSRILLACEARGVFLSRRFEVLFWSPRDLRERLEGQVESALSHCEGAPERISRGPSGFGLTGCDMSGFEDLSVNVSAVLSGHTPPGWHRMEWTPHGAGAVPHLTY